MSRVIVVISLLLLSACVTQEKKVVDSEISRRLAVTTPKSFANCKSIIVKVIDGRTDDSVGAAMGLDATLTDTKTVLSKELERAGVRTQESETNATIITLKRVYLMQQRESTNVTVVINVEVPGQPAKIIRGQATSVLWMGKAEESEKALAQVFGKTVTQVVDYLNQTCTEAL